MATSDKVFRCKNSTSDQLAYLDRRLDCGHEFHRKCLFTWGYPGIPCTLDHEGIPHPWDPESIPCPKCHIPDRYGRTLCHLDFEKKKSQCVGCGKPLKVDGCDCGCLTYRDIKKFRR
ncbi:hypothetical protein AVEN_65618-1 [Araneus ventricosus]|uniref:Uncharacterized protein n=1 Tax=Araneus ventricosus TaxID=182803 RepID=A0A4Y2VPY7_ARAVE|nr:hypothetical protein AVEN_65618-1 [Araneus ventricosus]